MKASCLFIVLSQKMINQISISITGPKVGFYLLFLPIRRFTLKGLR
jgi:hypothetical protein